MAIKLFQPLLVFCVCNRYYFGWCYKNLPEPCDSEIYCKGGEGTLLHTVQLARIYNDSKTFVDQPIKASPSNVLNNFEKLMQVIICRSNINYTMPIIIVLKAAYICRWILKDHNGKPNKKEVNDFVQTNFSPEGTEFEEWNPIDWNKDVPVYKTIKVTSYNDYLFS